MLASIKSPEDLKNIPRKKLPELAEEIRKTIIEVVGSNGGHLASNLGVVELTIALHRVFNSPEDAIVWDVSHQCYAHKLLTGRYKDFTTLRMNGGMSGFTKKNESPHDFFDNGHSSTSISSALGLQTAWSLQNKGGHVIAVIGDGALTGGMAFEALSNGGQIGKKLIVVLNDNQMSIDQNTGALSSYLSRLTATPHYQSFRYAVDSVISHIPVFGKFFTKCVFRFKRGLKGLVLSNNIFSDFGFDYVGPLDGHDEKTLEQIFRDIQNFDRPIVVHVVTKKGKGYSPAEDHPEKFHGIGPFSTVDGTVEKFDSLSFTESFSNSLLKLSEKNDKIACITAAMAKGTGLSPFSRRYPERFFDVGIAEEHAVTFAGGLSRGGLVPVVCIYSTFIQRSVDQIIHDISLQNLPCVIVLDRAGPVPGDGETHQGLFDIALFRPVPGIEIISPASATELELSLEYAVTSKKAVIIRYPKMSCPSEREEFNQQIVSGRGVLLKAENLHPSLEISLEEEKSVPRVLFVTTGGMYSEVLVASRALVLDEIIADIYCLRFIKPVDTEYFYSIAKDYDGVVFVEDGVVTGGISEYLSGVLSRKGFNNFSIKAFPEKYFTQGSRAQVCEQAGMSSQDLTAEAKNLIKIKK